MLGLDHKMLNKRSMIQDFIPDLEKHVEGIRSKAGKVISYHFPKNSTEIDEEEGR